MKLDTWLFSAKLAWDNVWIRWLSILTILLVLFMCVFYLWNTISSVKEHEFFVMHYNLYLGIDDVRGWPWLFSLPAVWVVITMTDIMLAYGMYRADPHFSLSLILLAFGWSLPFSVALFYLSFVNL